MLRQAYILLAISALATCSQIALSDKHSVSDRWSWSYCGDGTSSPLKIQSISVQPDPPKSGANMTVTVLGDVNKTIDEGAYVDVAVKVRRIKVLQKTFDLCEEARNANATVKCPVKAGSYEVVQTVELPNIPPARYSVHVEGYTVDDDDLVCLDLQADFRYRRGG